MTVKHARVNVDFTLAGYAKLYSSLLTSSVWSLPHPTRIAWITLLASADADGRVLLSLSSLAHQARITPAEAAEAVASLSAPDPDSRSPDADGRRLEPIPGGWLLTGFARYRAEGDDRRAYERSRKAVWRSASRTTSPPQTPSEAEAEAEARHAGQVRDSPGQSGTQRSFPDMAPAARVYHAPRRSRSSEPDGEWLSRIAADPAYQGIDVPAEVARCRIWCSERRKLYSRRRIIAWLNRTEKPVNTNAQFRPSQHSATQEPPRWRERVAEAFPEALILKDERNWSDLPESQRQTVLTALKSAG